METEAQGRDLEPAPSDSTAPRLPVLCTASREMGAPIFGKCKITEGSKAGIQYSCTSPLNEAAEEYFVCLFVYMPNSFPKEFEAAYKMYA